MGDVGGCLSGRVERVRGVEGACVGDVGGCVEEAASVVSLDVASAISNRDLCPLI